MLAIRAAEGGYEFDLTAMGLAIGIHLSNCVGIQSSAELSSKADPQGLHCIFLGAEGQATQPPSERF
jgi:hypothetical protein